MSKILVFGCSLSADGHLMSWSNRIQEHYNILGKNIEIKNFAIPASSNFLQIKRFQEFLVNSNIGEDDIVIWQVTGCERGFRRISNRVEKDFPEEFSSLVRKKSMFFDGCINYFDKKRRIDLLCHHPECVGSHIDEEEVLQELLFTLKVAKQFTKKVLVFVGWDEAFPSNMHSKIFTKFLKDHNIEIIEESLMAHTVKNKFPVLPDGIHPGEEGYISYADTNIIPLLDKLKWL